MGKKPHIYPYWKLARANSRAARAADGHCPNPRVCQFCPEPEECQYTKSPRPEGSPRGRCLRITEIMSTPHPEIFKDFRTEMSDLVKLFLSSSDLDLLEPVWEKWVLVFVDMAAKGKYEKESMRIGYVAAITDLLGEVLDAGQNHSGRGGD